MKIFGRNIFVAPWYDSILSELDKEIFEYRENTIANNAALFTASRIISDNISTIPIALFKKVKGDKTKIKDDPRHYMLNRRPNDTMNCQVWRSTMVYEIIDKGNAFSRIFRNDNEKDRHFGKAVRTEILDNVDMTRYHTSDDGTKYYILIDEKGKEIDKVPFQQQIHC